MIENALPLSRLKGACKTLLCVWPRDYDVERERKGPRSLPGRLRANKVLRSRRNKLPALR